MIGHAKANYGLAILIAMIGFCCLYAIRSMGGTAKLSCNETMYDFGNLQKNAKVKHAFTIRNVGNRKLQILGLSSQCTCTTARLVKDTLYPSETAQLDVELDVSGREGIVVSRIFLKSNDATEPEKTFTVRAVTSKGLQLLPAVVHFGSIEFKQNATKSADVQIYCQSPSSLVVRLDDFVSPSSIHVALKNLDGQGTPRLHVWLEGEIPIGPLMGTIRVFQKTNETEQVAVSVIGEVAGPMRAQPDFVSFGLINSRSKIARRISLVGRDKMPPERVQIEGVSESLASFIDVILSETAGLQRLDVSVRPGFLAPKDAGEIKGAIRLRGTGPKKYPLVVPVQLFLGGMEG